MIVGVEAGCITRRSSLCFELSTYFARISWFSICLKLERDVLSTSTTFVHRSLKLSILKLLKGSMLFLHIENCENCNFSFSWKFPLFLVSYYNFFMSLFLIPSDMRLSIFCYKKIHKYLGGGKNPYVLFYKNGFSSKQTKLTWCETDPLYPGQYLHFCTDFPGSQGAAN